jgi:hypothetical protein
VIKLEASAEFKANTFFDVELRKLLEQTAYPYFRAWSNKLLDDRLAGPNKDEPYTVTIDNAPAAGREAIDLATKSVRINFVQSTVNLAADILITEMQRAIGDRTPPWYASKNLSTQVLLFYGKRDGGVTRLNSSSEIKTFLPGDFVMVVPDSPYQAYANTSGKGPAGGGKKHGFGGFMGLAARRIRSRLAIGSKRTSALFIGAVRSRAVYRNLGPTDNGRPVTKPNWGAWCIIVRYNKSTVFRT